MDKEEAERIQKLVKEAKSIDKAPSTDNKADKVELEGNHTAPVWVRFYKNGQIVGTGGMTLAGEVNTAYINLKTLGKYAIVVKDKENGNIVQLLHFEVKADTQG